jgi:hypothetical protein
VTSEKDSGACAGNADDGREQIDDGDGISNNDDDDNDDADVVVVVGVGVVVVVVMGAEDIQNSAGDGTSDPARSISQSPDDAEADEQFDLNRHFGLG